MNFKYALAGILLLTAGATSQTQDKVVFREGCGGPPWTHVKWRIYVPEYLTSLADKWNRANWTVTKTINAPDCVQLYGVSVDGVADRFVPSVVTVDTNSTPDYWSYTLSRGSLEKQGHTLYVYGDGAAGEARLSVTLSDATEELLVPFKEEPRCGTEGDLDCLGNAVRGSGGFIYYGEDDDLVVTWELGVLVYASHDKYGINTPIELMREYPEQWDKWENRVQQYNEVYEVSGVHVRYELKEVWLAHYHDLRDVERLGNQLPVDVVLAYGTSYRNTCGVAYPNTKFNLGNPPSSMSRCDIYTDLHEIGHSVGLAHGPENQSNAKSGYIFPEFGHGWNDICGSYDDIMSYGYYGYYHTNSELLCNEVFSNAGATPAGYRDTTDTAYAINRVRYDVSLVNDEYAREDEVLRPVRVQARRLREAVID